MLRHKPLPDPPCRRRFAGEFEAFVARAGEVVERASAIAELRARKRGKLGRRAPGQILGRLAALLLRKKKSGRSVCGLSAGDLRRLTSARDYVGRPYRCGSTVTFRSLLQTGHICGRRGGSSGCSSSGISWPQERSHTFTNSLTPRP